MALSGPAVTEAALPRFHLAVQITVVILCLIASIIYVWRDVTLTLKVLNMQFQLQLNSYQIITENKREHTGIYMSSIFALLKPGINSMYGSNAFKAW